MAETKTRTSRASSASGRSANKRSSSGSKSSGGQSGQAERSTVGTIAEKAKGPALAGGAALVGIAGGVAMARKRGRGNLLHRIPTPKNLPKLSAPDISLPKPDSLVQAVGEAAGKVADRSHRVGDVATQVQRASQAINGSRSDTDGR
jgi:hypothetical protein